MVMYFICVYTMQFGGNLALGLFLAILIGSIIIYLVIAISLGSILCAAVDPICGLFLKSEPLKVEEKAAQTCSKGYQAGLIRPISK